VCAHRWIHAGEPGYGVALLTDSTYGFDAGRATRDEGGTTTTVRLSLVRGPRSPDPEADQGQHRFSYSLLPGATIADAVAGGYALNLPLRLVNGGIAGGTAAPEPLVTADGDGVAIEAVKLADDGSGDVVVRLYECQGGRAATRLRVAFPVTRVSVTDLLERPLEVPVRTADPDGAVPLTLRPFQVLTVRLAR
jgi:alpha-mannosidase